MERRIVLFFDWQNLMSSLKAISISIKMKELHGSLRDLFPLEKFGAWKCCTMGRNTLVRKVLQNEFSWLVSSRQKEIQYRSRNIRGSFRPGGESYAEDLKFLINPIARSLRFNNSHPSWDLEGVSLLIDDRKSICILSQYFERRSWSPALLAESLPPTYGNIQSMTQGMRTCSPQ